MAVEHGKRRFPLRRPGGARKRGIDRKAVAVIHQDVAHEAQPALAAVGLAVEPRVGIGGRGMALVLALLLAEVALAPLRPGPGGEPEPSFVRKLFIDAQASISMPSPEKCSLESSALTCGSRQALALGAASSITIATSVDSGPTSPKISFAARPPFIATAIMTGQIGSASAARLLAYAILLVGVRASKKEPGRSPRAPSASQSMTWTTRRDPGSTRITSSPCRK